MSNPSTWADRPITDPGIPVTRYSRIASFASGPTRRAKIICTLGPATASAAKVDELIVAGMDCARLNFSHGDHPRHAQAIAWVREAAAQRNRAVAILADLQGPKIRVGDLPGGKVELRPGETVTLASGDAENVPPGAIPTTYPFLADDVQVGDTIRLDDGRFALKVLRKRDRLIDCEVYTGGWLLDHKGMNLPGVALRIGALTEKDKIDLKFAVAQGVDYIALSFVRGADDVRELRDLLEDKRLPIIAKLERPEAVQHLEEIMDEADGVMVARGDLGVEFPPQRVPVIQKQIMHMAALKRVPVIVATEMLNSMCTSPRPTRAEASDVANAVFDGADALMLSGETASGEYPVRSVVFMDRIIREAENARELHPMMQAKPPADDHIWNIEASVARAACQIAGECGARLIAAFTKGGTTAKLISRARPEVPIVAFSSVESVQRQLALFWGLVPQVAEPSASIDELVASVETRLVQSGFALPGDRVVIVFGAPLHVPGNTNTIRVHQIGAPKS